MILSKMLKQCKKNKHIQIFTYGDYDYLSDGSVAGVIDADVDDWTAEDCAAAIGISDDERDKYIFPPAAFSNITDYEDAVPLENAIELPSGTVIQPFMLVDRRIFFVNAELLNIFDEFRDKRYFFGHDTLFVMRDVYTLGFINPMRVNLNKLSAYAADLLTGLNASEEAAFFHVGRANGNKRAGRGGKRGRGMREILFRGKCGISRVWVCGYYTRRDNDGDIEHHIEGIRGVSFRIFPETVGQWTGLKDKNGKQIFEGDILKGYQYPFYNDSNDTFNYYAIVMWFDTAFGLLSVKAPKANVVGRNAGNVDDMSDFSSDEWEIIGNIHDNPELLEVEA